MRSTFKSEGYNSTVPHIVYHYQHPRHSSVAPSWNRYLQLLRVILTAVQTLGWLNKLQSKHPLICVHLLQKSLHNFKTKTRAETSIKRMWWHIKPYTKQSSSVIHFLLFYFSSSVFIRHRHKDEGLHGAPDNMWIVLELNGRLPVLSVSQTAFYLFHNCGTLCGKTINRISTFSELRPSSYWSC